MKEKSAEKIVIGVLGISAAAVLLLSAFMQLYPLFHDVVYYKASVERILKYYDYVIAPSVICIVAAVGMLALSVIGMIKFAYKGARKASLAASIVCTVISVLPMLAVFIVYLIRYADVHRIDYWFREYLRSTVPSSSTFAFWIEIAVLVLTIVCVVKLKPNAEHAAAVADANAQTTEQSATPTAAPVKPVITDGGYVEMVGHIVLTVLVYVVYGFIWIFRTTEYLNCANDGKKYSGVNQLLLCMFVPLYMVYWTYVQSKRIDKLAEEKGVKGEICTLGTVLSAISSPLAVIVLQHRLNEICTAPQPKNETEN